MINLDITIKKVLKEILVSEKKETKDLFILNEDEKYYKDLLGNPIKINANQKPPVGAIEISKKVYDIISLDPTRRFDPTLSLQPKLDQMSKNFERQMVSQNFPKDKYTIIPSIQQGQNTYVYPTSIIKPDANLAMVSKTESNFYYKIKDIVYLGGYNRELAEKFFGRQCKKLSGEHPNYNVGFDYKIDYYINDSGVKCFPNVLKSQVVDLATDKSNKNYTKREFNLPTNSSTKLKNGNDIKISKNSYPKGCKPIPYNTCLEFSWQVMQTSNNTNGVYSFVIEKYEVQWERKPFGKWGKDKFIPPWFFNQSEEKKDPWVKKGDGILKSKAKYTAVMTDEWFPWFNQFVNKEKPGQIYTNNYKEEKNNFGTWEITRSKLFGNKTGVEIVENNYLKDKNLSSGDFKDFPTSFIDLSNNFLEKNKVINLDYSNWQDNWFTNEYFSYEKKINLGGNLKTPAYYETLINDFYGISSDGKQDISKLGFETQDEEYYKAQDLKALEKKYEDIKKQKQDTRSFLAVIAKDYQSELKKSPPNNLIVNYLGVLWNQTLLGQFSKFLDLFENLECVKNGIDLPKSWLMGIILLKNDTCVAYKTNTINCVAVLNPESESLKTKYFSTPSYLNLPPGSEKLSVSKNDKGLNFVDPTPDRNPKGKCTSLLSPSFKSKLPSFIPFPMSSEGEKNNLGINSSVCAYLAGSSESQILNGNVKFFQVSKHKIEDLFEFGGQGEISYEDLLSNTTLKNLLDSFPKGTYDNKGNIYLGDKNKEEKFSLSNAQSLVKSQRTYQNALNQIVSTHLILPAK